MSTYAIGDIHGCYDELQRLLELIAFDDAQDQLWFTGDLVNRGPQSLAVLRFIKRLKNAIVVLGNHDIHLLALAAKDPFKDHTLQAVLAAPDCEELVEWLRRQRLLYYDATLNYLIVHAGIYPFWSLTQVRQYAAEVESFLQCDHDLANLRHLYGNEPDYWDEALTGFERLRFITNVLTRLRFCTATGKLDFKHAGKVGSQPPEYLPWFEMIHRTFKSISIVFGHWAALSAGQENHSSAALSVSPYNHLVEPKREKIHRPQFLGIDTGCVWGRALTALRLEDHQMFSVSANTKNVIS